MKLAIMLAVLDGGGADLQRDRGTGRWRDPRLDDVDLYSDEAGSHGDDHMVGAAIRSASS